MLTLPTKELILPKPEQWQLDQIKPVDGELGMFQRDTIADYLQADIDAYSLQMYWENEPRHHLGASVIGHYCIRFVWMHFRWVLEEIPKPRMTRLWYRGHREEPVIIQQLRGIGCNVIEIEDGEQLHIQRDEADGHFGGSLDALIQMPARYGLPPIWFLLEMKALGDKYYKDFANLGVLKAKMQYYSQMCVYAHKITQLGKYGTIDYALFYPVNKNNDEISPEIVRLDRNFGQEEINKAEYLSRQYHPPIKLSTSESHWECKICPMHKICHLNQPYAVNCRSCRFAEPVADGQWRCHNYNQIIPKDFLIKGCPAWESLPR